VPVVVRLGPALLLDLSLALGQDVQVRLRQMERSARLGVRHEYRHPAILLSAAAALSSVSAQAMIIARLTRLTCC
jgi:hypothetical protein